MRPTVENQSSLIINEFDLILNFKKGRQVECKFGVARPLYLCAPQKYQKNCLLLPIDSRKYGLYRNIIDLRLLAKSKQNT